MSIKRWNLKECGSTKVTDNGNLKHRQLRFEDYLQKISAEQKEYAEVCTSPKMTETDNTNTNEQTEELLEQILRADNLNRANKQVKVRVELTVSGKIANQERRISSCIVSLIKYLVVAQEIHGKHLASTMTREAEIT